MIITKTVEATKDIEATGSVCIIVVMGNKTHWFYDLTKKKHVLDFPQFNSANDDFDVNRKT